MCCSDRSVCASAQRDGSACFQARLDQASPACCRAVNLRPARKRNAPVLVLAVASNRRVVWSATHLISVLVLQTTFWAGWGLVLLSTFLINHFELFGLQQVFARLRSKALPPAEFKTPSLYKWVRHPLYLGLLLAFWATPTMTLGHLLFAVANTSYILIGLSLEERDLLAVFGDQYRRYREQVSMLLPIPRRKAEPQGQIRRL